MIALDIRGKSSVTGMYRTPLMRAISIQAGHCLLSIGTITGDIGGEVEGGVSGSLTKDQGVIALMKNYYQSCNFDPDDDFWSSLFQPFLD